MPKPCNHGRSERQWTVYLAAALSSAIDAALVARRRSMEPEPRVELLGHLVNRFWDSNESGIITSALMLLLTEGEMEKKDDIVSLFNNSLTSAQTSPQLNIHFKNNEIRVDQLVLTQHVHRDTKKKD